MLRISWLAVSLALVLSGQEIVSFLRPITVRHAGTGITAETADHGAAPGSLVIVGLLTFERDQPVIQEVRLTRVRLERILPIVRAEKGTAWVVLPADLTPGPASIRAFVDGEPTSPAAIQIVPSNFQLFAQTQFGARPLKSSSLTRPSRPGQTVTIYGTGLGNATRENISVILAGRRREIAPHYAGPSPGTPGLDQINFTIPEDAPENCYVGIEVRTGERTSLMGSLSISRTFGSCMHPLGFSGPALRRLEAGDKVIVASGEIRTDYDDSFEEPRTTETGASVRSLPDGGPRRSLFAFEELAQNGVRDELVPCWPGGARRTLCAFGDFSANPNHGAVDFRWSDLFQVAEKSPKIGERESGACQQILDDRPFLIFPDKVDAGSTLTLYGPANTALPFTTGENRGYYYLSRDDGEFFSFRAGSWLLAGGGGLEAGSFIVRFGLPPQPPWVHRPNLSVIDSTQDVDLWWDGSLFASTDIGTLSLSRYVFDSSFLSGVVVGVQCHVPAQTGHATIPRAWLRDIPPTTRGLGAYTMALEIRPARDATFAIPLPQGGSGGGILRTSRRFALQVEVR